MKHLLLFLLLLQVMSVSLRAESYDKDSIYIKERIVYETEVNLENNDSEGHTKDKHITTD